MNKATLFFLIAIGMLACQSKDSETWHFDNLEIINGHSVEVEGNPKIVMTNLGLATYFDGIDDRLLIDKNPINGASAFTVEIILKADNAFETNNDPRFMHIQDPSDMQEKRLMFELRINKMGNLYFDGFLKTDIDRFALIDSNLTHPCNQWLHAAVTYDGSLFSSYINGMPELQQTVNHQKKIMNTEGQTSIGGRMNRVAYFKGFVKTMRVTQQVLLPSEFLKIE